MDIKWLLLLSITTLAYCYNQCPSQCTCNLDDRGRIQTICNRGQMTSIPIHEMDPKVEVLIIRGPRNDLTIGPIFLPNLKNLEIIRVTDSNIPSVGTYSFWGLEHLRTLDLSRNNITAIARDNFKGQEHLEELDLSSNKITGLTSWVFDNLKDLQRFSLANNFIEKLANRVFYKVSKLKYLDLSENPLADLPPDVFTDIMELKELRCRKCLLKEINSKLFQCVPHLMELDLGENYLKHIDDGDFKDLKRLKTLYLDGNQFTNIVGNVFQSQKSLEFLDMSHNQLMRIPNDAFSLLTNLTSLDLSYNKIHKMNPGTVTPWKKLHTLNISGNTQLDLFHLRLTFYNLRHLTHLSVADMSAIPLNFLESFHHLKMLNLSGNHLVNKSFALLDGIRTLEVLDLSRNYLNGFDLHQVWKLRLIKDVILDSNPLICDRCHMGPLIDIAQTLTWNVYPICHLPASLRGRPVTTLNVTALSSCDVFDENQYDMSGISDNILLIRGNFNLFAIVCAIGFITIAIIVLIVILGVNRQSAKYYTNEEKRSEGLYEKNFDTLSITGNELSYKFPVDDIIYTLDENTLQPTQPTHPALISSFISRSTKI